MSTWDAWVHSDLKFVNFIAIFTDLEMSLMYLNQGILT